MDSFSQRSLTPPPLKLKLTCKFSIIFITNANNVKSLLGSVLKLALPLRLQCKQFHTWQENLIPSFPYCNRSLTSLFNFNVKMSSPIALLLFALLSSILGNSSLPLPPLGEKDEKILAPKGYEMEIDDDRVIFKKNAPQFTLFFSDA